jgi:hypothetical protein
MQTIVFIVVALVLAGLAITLGLKFFNTSVRQEEHEKGWQD